MAYSQFRKPTVEHLLGRYNNVNTQEEMCTARFIKQAAGAQMQSRPLCQ